MLLIPYRAKNPPERTPYCTLSLIAINTLVFALTSHTFLSIKEGVVRDWAVSHETMSVLRLFTAMFLHGSLLHLAGNMLFLWIFGSAVEGRLGPGRFLLVYFAAGITGGLLHDVMIGLLNPRGFGLGASGAIMGLAGAYLYLFPFATICVLFGYSLRMRLMEWQARWVILYFVAFDLLYGMLSKSGIGDGVAHFAHLGGAGAGFLGVMLLRARRDSEDYSNAQAVRAQVREDYDILGLPELEVLMENPNGNVRLVLAFCRKAAKQVNGTGYGLALNALRDHARLLLDEADPEELARLVFAIPESAGVLPVPFLLRLAGKLEAAGSYALAARAYRRITELNPQSPDAETALYKLARLTEQTDKGGAAAVYAEMLHRFPHGQFALQARDARKRLPDSGFVFSPGPSAPAAPAAPAAPPPAPDPDIAPVHGAPTPARSAAATDDLAPVGGHHAGDDLRPVGG